MFRVLSNLLNLLLDMYRVLSILLLLLILTVNVKSQVPQSKVEYGVQLLSTSIYPYPFEGKIFEVAHRDSVYVEEVLINERSYFRYCIKVASLLEANQVLVIARERFPDSFIIYYNEGKRFN